MRNKIKDNKKTLTNIVQDPGWLKIMQNVKKTMAVQVND